MTTLRVRIGDFTDMKSNFAQTWKDAEVGKRAKPRHELIFRTYEDMHRVLSPARLEVVMVLAGQGPLSMREVARRVGRDVKAVHSDITALINCGMIDRTEEGISFPYDRIHLDVDIEAAA
ncbi:transcriptional regulator [Parvibaculum sp.]|uniref:HVO_A0114 family putative DNA-binding protein n=1 Tax=Parvibaculum sp. TaxID=2024848 RepID=UPI001B0AABB8|nr:transcriptional regulator [Parvibaculum sp.]MBO6667900.1 transcriptional regulator [Parvibaculum sp.]MBO6690513.1 transcriptional regulator [Parvibaculum sp.]MBO6714864.1 transcriptional regulator [Parvibaculum sp.]